MPGRHRITPHGEHARLGAVVRRLRTDQGVTQKELATRLGLPQSFVSKIERGERQLQVVELLPLCRAIGIEPCTVLNALAESEA